MVTDTERSRGARGPGWWLRRLGIGLLGAMGTVLVLAGGLLLFFSTDSGTRWAAERALQAVRDTGAAEVRVGAVEGSLFDTVTLRDLVLADAQGEWLNAERVTLAWRPTRLLAGQIWVDRLVAREVTVSRPPVSPVGAAAEEEETTPLQDGGIGPGLLGRLTVRRLDVDAVRLGAPVVGTPVAFRAEGHLVGTAAGGLTADLKAERLDQPGEARLDLAYRPGGVLAVHAVAYEPPGGVLARLMGLPGLPALRVTLDGEGPAQDWVGALLAEAEDVATVEADVHLSLRDVWTAAVRGQLRPGPQAPDALWIAFGQHLGFSARLAQPAGGPVVAEAVTLAGQGWRMTGEGRWDREGGAVSGEAVLTVEDGTVVEALSGIPVGEARLAVTASGPVDALQVSADLTARRAIVEEVVAHVEATIGDTIPFQAEGRVEGLEGLATQAGPLVTGGLDFEVGAVYQPRDGSFDVDRLVARTEPATVAYAGSVALKPLALIGTLEASVEDLAALAPLTGMTVRGQGTLAADLRAGPDAVEGDLRVTLDDFATGIEQADALLAGHVEAASQVFFRGETVRLNDLAVEAPGAALQGGFRVRDFQGVDGTFVLAVEELAVLDVGVAGAARAGGTVTGTLGDPVLAGTVTGREVVVQGVPVGRPEGRVRLTTERLDVREAAFSVAGAAAQGQMTIPFDTGLLDGRVALRLADPEVLAATIGQPVTGDLRAEVVLQPVDGVQLLAVQADGENVVMPEAGVAVANLDVEARLTDPFGAPSGTLAVGAGNGTAGPVPWRVLKASADVQPDGTAFRVDLTGPDDRPYTARAAGRLDMGEAVAVHLDDFRAEDGTHSIALAQPATVSLADGIAFGPTRLSLDGSSLTVAFSVVDDRIAAEISGDAVPLSALEVVRPDFLLQGTVAVQGRIAGPLSGPEGRLTLRSSDLVLPEADVEGLRMDAEAILETGRLRADARFTGLTDEPAVVRATLPVAFSESGIPTLPAEQPFSVEADWQGPVQPLWALVPQVGHRLAGPARVEARVTGTIDEPVFSGEAVLQDAVYENLEWGTVLRELEATAELAGQGLVRILATATDGEGGKFRVEGTLDASGPEASDLQGQVILDELVVVRRDDIYARTNAVLSYEGSLDDGTLSGEARTETVRFRLGAALGGGIPELDVVEVNRAALDGDATPGDGEADREPEDVSLSDGEAGQEVALAVDVVMPNRVYVTGQGLDSEWQGELEIRGSAADARITGTMTVVRGNFSALGKTFVLESGTVRLRGGETTSPELNIRAVHEAEDITAILHITGTADAPDLELASNPSLPQDEIIARVLFGKSVSDLGVAEGVAAARMAAQLAGVGGTGPDLLGLLRNRLDLDVLAVGGDEGGPTLEAGKYIGDNVYVGVEQGTAQGTGEVEVEVELTPRVTVETKGSAERGADVGLEWKFDY